MRVRITAMGEPLSADASVNITAARVMFQCEPYSAPRGTRVDCAARWSDDAPITVTSAYAMMSGLGVTARLRDGVGVPGPQWRSKGPRLTSSEVTITVAPAPDGSVSAAVSSAFALDARIFPKLSWMQTPSTRWMDDIPSLDEVWYQRRLYGRLQEPRLDFSLPLGVLTANSGPKQGYAIAASSVPLEPPVVYLNQIFNGFRNTVVDDQDGRNGSDEVRDGTRYCNATDPWLANLEAFIRRHEGVTGASNSHWADYDRELQKSSLERAMEATVVPQTQAEIVLKARFLKLLAGWYRANEARITQERHLAEYCAGAVNQEALDQFVDGIAGCALDWDRSQRP